jgi:DNA end-binding protein Ku
MDAIDELDRVPEKVKAEEIKLAKQVIDTFEAPLDLSEYRDEYQEQLRKIIDKKIAGEEIVAPTEEAPPKVVDLMEALKKSLDRVSTGKKITAKADLRKPAPAKTAKKKRA